MRPLPRLLFCVSALVLAAAPPRAQENEDCLACHDIEDLEIEVDGQLRSVYVDPERYDESIHGALDCIVCHYELDGVEEYPHAKGLERVDCTLCHDDDDGPVQAYRDSKHGQLAEQGFPGGPLCQDCHGGHDVFPLSDPQSRLSALNIDATCAACHAADEDEAGFLDRIHGDPQAGKGLLVSANCASCHGGHAVEPASDPASRVSSGRVNETCMSCHGGVREIHEEVVAADVWADDLSSPRCVDCHAPHSPQRATYLGGIGDRRCLRCHEDATPEHPGSVHGRSGLSCASCHSQVAPSSDRPCVTITDSVRCDACHAGVAREHLRGVHGSLAAEGDENAPLCSDCHGTHGVLEHALTDDMTPELRALVRSSPTFPRNVPELCGKCHRDGAPAAVRRNGSQEHVLQSYDMSIHGKGLIESGLLVTAVCTDCHTPHRELPASDPESTVHGDQVATTCGRCHDGIQEVFEASIHTLGGNPEYLPGPSDPALPHCNDCHSSHDVASTGLPEFQLGIMDQCGSCHAEITETYFETYHGKASALGNTARAKCYDCHGSHGIFPTDDLRSPLHPANIVDTCGNCHEGSHEQFTTYLTHANHHDRERYPALFYAFWGMTSLLIGVFVFFGLHTAIWLPRSWKLAKQHKDELAAIPSEAKQYMRFSRLSRALHLTVILTFFGLAVTGMMLKFSQAGWAQMLASMMGGIGSAGFIHRVCAVATFGYMGVHLVDVARRLRRTDKSLFAYFTGPDSLVPRLKDARDFIATMKWFVGRGPMPNYSRWTYWEKFDYFAVFWGVVIIGLSGLILWFPVFFTRFLPGWAINVATIIHSDEALLAVGFIFTIHFFNTHLRPEKFPMDPVIFTGRMRLKELKLERPRHYANLQASGELEKRLVDPAPAHFVTVARVFGYCALFFGVTLIVLIVASLLGLL